MTDQTQSLPTILVVEDEEFHLKSLVNLLSSNYRIKVAINGEQALKLLQNNNLPDLILLDVVMPGISGYETCTKIKNNEKLNHIPVIFITAKSTSKDIIKGFELGAVDYITKPFNPPELNARVKTHLELKKSRETIAEQSAERNELIHILCHDLANPIGGVKGLIDFVKQGNIDYKKVQDSVEISINNVFQTIRLVKKMQALSDMKIAMNIETYNLNQMVEESLKVLQLKIQEKKINIKLNIIEQSQIKVDRTSFINTVLNNLLTNAIKFSEVEGTIIIESQLSDDQVILSIQDHGIGIPENTLKTMFDVKTSVSRIGTKGEIGTGYGMALVKRFIESYGGIINVESQEKMENSSQHGTKVQLLLPV